MTKARVDSFKFYGYDDDEKKVKIAKDDSAYCENCGHTQRLWGEEKYICRYCGTMVFRNDKVKFKYRLKEKMIRERRKENGKDND